MGVLRHAPAWADITIKCIESRLISMLMHGSFENEDYIASSIMVIIKGAVARK